MDRFIPQRRAGQLMPLLRCPVCRNEMERGSFAANSPIVVDVCSQQHGLWLDGGELPAALQYAAHRSQVGTVQTRREQELGAGDARSYVQQQTELQVLKVKSDHAMTMARWKQAAVLLAVLVFAGRMLLVVLRAHDRARRPVPTLPGTR